MLQDTISAISTAPGKGAISVVRISGDEAIDIVNRVFHGTDLTSVDSHTVHYGHIVDNETTVDEVLVTVFLSPRSFTTEDMIEISCHGGSYVSNKVLGLLLDNGARIANPGEFTERAFLHGRIDLTQAEAVMDVVNAKSDLSLTLANKGLDGEVYHLITDFRDQLLDIIAHIEVNIDYPEYDDVTILSNNVVKPKIKALQEDIKKILKKAQYGKVIREGLKTAIIGRPNVGKSSLLNALLREDKAIVTDVQGTTRDIVEGQLNLGGIILHLIDTAGIRKAKDKIEQIGIDKAKDVINEAELILFVLDNNQPLNEDDKTLLELTKNAKRIVIVNKTDLESKLNYNFEHSVSISALHGTGIDTLEQQIQSMFLKGHLQLQHEMILSNTRHISLLRETMKSLAESVSTIEQDMPIDMVEIDLKQAWSLLGEIIGDTSSTSLLDELFSKFCLGK